MKFFTKQTQSLFIFILFSILFSVSLFSQADTAFQFQTTSNLELISGGTAEFAVDVFIPEDKHLYIKNDSVMSFNIPTDFIVKTKGFTVSVKESPEGEKKEEDLILRGAGSQAAGTYVITLFETSGRKPSTKAIEVILEINTQFCITESDKCLAPKKITKKIKVVVNGDKVATLSVKAGDGGVKWIDSLNTAKNNADRSTQNIFVVVTAPTWCGYCKLLERDVFAKEKVIKTLNSNFVSLQVLDTSPDLSKFNINGFPHMLILDSKGKVIVNDVYGRDENSFLAAVKKYEKASGGGADIKPVAPDIDPAKAPYVYSIKQEFKFNQKADGSWESFIGDSSSPLTEVRRDENYIILLNPKTKRHYALPAKPGGTAYYMLGKSWKPFD